MYQMEIGVGGDRILIGDLERRLGEDPAGVDSGIDKVDRGADPLWVVLCERPVPAVHSPVTERDAGVHIDDGAVHRRQDRAETIRVPCSTTRSGSKEVSKATACSSLTDCTRWVGSDVLFRLRPPHEECIPPTGASSAGAPAAKADEEDLANDRQPSDPSSPSPGSISARD